MTKNVNNRKEIEFAPVEGPLNMYIIASNETTLASKIPNIVNEVNGATKNTFSILSDEFCEEQAFPYLFFTDTFGYNAPQDILGINPACYFNQRSLNFNQYMQVLCLLPGLYMNSTTYFYQYTALHEIKPDILTAETITIILKEQLKGLLRVIYDISERNTSILETVFI